MVRFGSGDSGAPPLMQSCFFFVSFFVVVVVVFSFNEHGIQSLVHCWQKHIANGGDCVEKEFCS